MLRPSNSLLRFALVGAIGFAIDGGVMQLITSATGTSPLIARAVSFPLALTLTWAMNRNWTFATGRQRAPASQYRRYVAVQIAGFAINYGTFAALVTAGGIWHAQPLLALFVGALLSMIFTYTLSRLHVFSGHLHVAAEPQDKQAVTNSVRCADAQRTEP